MNAMALCKVECTSVIKRSKQGMEEYIVKSCVLSHHKDGVIEPGCEGVNTWNPSAEPVICQVVGNVSRLFLQYKLLHQLLNAVGFTHISLHFRGMWNAKRGMRNEES